MPRARSALLGLSLGLGIHLGPATAAAGERWPLWPSEVQRAAAPMRAGQARNLLVVPETHKLQALRLLEDYPTALITPILLEALADPSVPIRRGALQACLERAILACTPAALQEWRSDRPDLGLRIAALRVLALDAATTPGRPELLLAALRETDESLRAEATHTLARVPWTAEQLPRMRTALIARLTDQAPQVRRAAARSLGLLGPPGHAAAASAGDTQPAAPASTGNAAPAAPAAAASTGDTAPTQPAAAASTGDTAPTQPAAPASTGDTAPTQPRAGPSTAPTDGATRSAAPVPRLPDPAPLALARLLADPDPQVRQDAAEALGSLRDPRAAAPLLRVLEAGDEAFVSRSLVLALAALPGPDIEAALLRLLDAPPRGLTLRAISEALGRRHPPGPALIAGLMARLREDALQAPVLEILLQLGEAAGPALRAAHARGLEPQLALPIERLLAALEPPARAASLAPLWPARTDLDAWHLRLGDPAGALPAALALAADPPPWLGRAAVGALAREHGAAARRPWLLALAAASRPLLPAGDAAAPARLAGWVADAGLAVLDRCLALAALERAHAPAHADLAAAALVTAASDPRPAVRACAAAIATDDALLAALLLDDSPRVRASASFHIAACPLRPSPATQSQIARLAAQDPHPGVVRAATAALAHLQAPSPEPCGLGLLDLDAARTPVPGDPAGAGWVDLRWRDRDLRLPTEALDDRRYLLLPALEDAILPGPGPR
jgi:HEAT repeat protein